MRVGPAHRTALTAVGRWWRDPAWAWPRVVAGMAVAAVLAAVVLR